MGTTLAIYGAGGLGREVLELARLINDEQGCWDDIVFVVDDEYAKPGAIANDAPIYGFEAFSKSREGEFEVVVAIGEPATKDAIFNRLKAQGVRFATLVHPGVQVPKTSTIGAGTVVSYACRISCNATVGENAFLHPYSLVGHDCVVGEGATIGSSCILGGATKVGDYSYLGMGVIVKELLTIGRYVIVSMAAAVFRDVEDEVIVIGNPGRVMRRNEEHKVFG